MNYKYFLAAAEHEKPSMSFVRTNTRIGCRHLLLWSFFFFFLGFCTSHFIQLTEIVKDILIHIACVISLSVLKYNCAVSHISSVLPYFMCWSTVNTEHKPEFISSNFSFAVWTQAWTEIKIYLHIRTMAEQICSYPSSCIRNFFHLFFTPIFIIFCCCCCVCCWTTNSNVYANLSCIIFIIICTPLDAYIHIGVHPLFEVLLIQRSIMEINVWILSVCTFAKIHLSRIRKNVSVCVSVFVNCAEVAHLLSFCCKNQMPCASRTIQC